MFQGFRVFWCLKDFWGLGVCVCFGVERIFGV